MRHFIQHIARLLLLITVLEANAQKAFQLNDDLQEFLQFELNQKVFVPGEELAISLSCYHKNYKISNLSKVAYVEIIDEEKKSVVSATLELKNGLGSGALYLPSLLKTGGYTVIAYTRWMKNYSQQIIQQTPISIINPYESLPSDFFDKKPLKEVQIALYPNGNFLYAGHVNEVIFRALNDVGQPLQITGRLVDEQDNLLAGLKTNSQGWGKLEFQFSSEKAYKMIFIDDQNNVHFKELNHLITRPSKVSVRDEDRQLSISISDLTSSDDYLVYVGQGNALRNQFSFKQSQLIIDETNLPCGVYWLQVYQSDKCIFEQHYYRNPEHHSMGIYTDQPVYSPKDSVGLTIEIPEHLIGEKVSLTVRKKLPKQIANDELSYSFRSFSNQEINYQLAGLRIPFTPSKGSNKAEYLPDFRGQLISGVVKSNDELASDIDISLSQLGKSPEVHFTKSNAEGNFYLNLSPTEETSRVVLSTVNDVPNQVITLEKATLANYDFVEVEPIKSSPVSKEWLTRRSVELQIENAYYSLRKKELAIDENKLGTWPKKTYRLDEFTRFPKLEDPVKEYIEEVWLKKLDNKEYFLFPYLKKNVGIIDTALTMINGVPVNAAFIKEQNPNHFQLIDIYPDQYNIDGYEFRGLINFRTYPDKLDKIDFGEQAKVFSFQLTTPYIDEIPNHKLAKSSSRIPDYRNLLLYIPHYTLASQKQQLFALTSESTGTYEVIMKGRTNESEFIYDRAEFVVKD